MSDLFGAEMPLAVRFFMAFLIVLGLIGVTAWAVRRFGSAKLGNSVRGRQPRLAVIDYAGIDARRRLILVRRDNVEHLLMIGGPTDVVVEANIVRATPAARETPISRSPAQMPRAVPLPEAVSNGSWPLQPEPGGPLAPPAPPRRTQRTEPMPEAAAGSSAQPHIEIPRRPPREALSALADDLAAHPVPAPRSRPAATPRSQAGESRTEPRAEHQPEPRSESRFPAQTAETAAAPDQSLAEMAHRLEAALRKGRPAEALEAPPPAGPVGPSPAAEPEQIATDDSAAPSPPPLPPTARQSRSAEAKPARAEPMPKGGKALYETLEQEMASLLGRQPSKSA